MHPCIATGAAGNVAKNGMKNVYWFAIGAIVGLLAGLIYGIDYALAGMFLGMLVGVAYWAVMRGGARRR